MCILCCGCKDLASTVVLGVGIGQRRTIDSACNSHPRKADLISQEGSKGLTIKVWTWFGLGHKSRFGSSM